MKQSGGCLCGGVQYEITGTLSDVYNSHCSMCRKLHAAAFRTCAKEQEQVEDWQTVEGQDLPKISPAVTLWPWRREDSEKAPFQ